MDEEEEKVGLQKVYEEKEKEKEKEKLKNENKLDYINSIIIGNFTKEPKFLQ